MELWSRYIYLNGSFLPYGEAKIPVLSAAVKYGAVVFEGLRAYWNAEQSELYVFRLKEHIDRLFDSLRIMRMEHSFTYDRLADSIIDTLRRNEVREDVHVRQRAYVEGEGNIDATGPVGLAVDARPYKLGGSFGRIAALRSLSHLRSNNPPGSAAERCLLAGLPVGRLAGPMKSPQRFPFFSRTMPDS